MFFVVRWQQCAGSLVRGLPIGGADLLHQPGQTSISPGKVFSKNLFVLEIQLKTQKRLLF